MLPEGHREWIQEELERYGVPPLPPPDADSEREQRGMAGLRIDPKSMEPLIEIAFAHKVALMASALGTPPSWLVEKAHANGVPVAALAGRIDHAVAHKE